MEDRGRPLVSFLVLGTGFVLGAWLLFRLGDLFRLNLGLCILLWIYTPILAAYLKSAARYASWSERYLIDVRTLLVVAAVMLSAGAFFHFDSIRDWIGRRYVEGYRTDRAEDYDSLTGQPFMTSIVSTDHWYSLWGLRAFEWLFLLTCPAIPWITWRFAAAAVRVVRERDERLRGIRGY